MSARRACMAAFTWSASTSAGPAAWCDVCEGGGRGVSDWGGRAPSAPTPRSHQRKKIAARTAPFPKTHVEGQGVHGFALILGGPGGGGGGFFGRIFVHFSERGVRSSE